MSHAHIYKPHYDDPGIVPTLLKRNLDHPPVKLQLKPEHFDQALEGLEDLDALVDLTKQLIEMLKPQYHPLPAIKNIPIMG